MGRGRSNWTKLSWAFQDYREDYLARRPNQHFYVHAFKRQLERSRWFQKHFLAMRNANNSLENLFYQVNKAKPTNLPEAWFLVTSRWNLNINAVAPKTPSKYAHLYYRDSESGTEVAYRKQAQFYLILTQHFLGRAEAQALLKAYKEHGVKYRKVRTDHGTKLVGTDLTEFKMRLEGHSLMVPAMTAEVGEDD